MTKIVVSVEKPTDIGCYVQVLQDTHEVCKKTDNITDLTTKSCVDITKLETNVATSYYS